MTKKDSLRINIAGVYYHVPMDVNECGEFDGVLKPEPTNPYDPNAIMVLRKQSLSVSNNGPFGTKKVGYIPRTKAPYIRKLIKDSRWPCKIVLKPVIDTEEDTLLGIEGCVDIEGIDMSEIETWKYDENIDPTTDKPVICSPTDPMKSEYYKGQYMIYISDPARHKSVIGYDEAYKLFSQLERMIYGLQGNLNIVQDQRPLFSPCPIQLTMMLKRKHFWQKDTVILQKREAKLLRIDCLKIEREMLGTDTQKKSKHRKKSGFWHSSNDGLSNLLSLFGMKSSGVPWLKDKRTDVFCKSSSDMSTLSDTDSFDHETFEKSIECDDYIDFRW